MRGPIRVFEGARGVRVKARSPHYVEEIIDDNNNAITTYETSTTVKDPQMFMQLWKQRPDFFKIKHGCAPDDKNTAETIANVLTSLPFVVIGLSTPRKNMRTTIYANSLIGVGVASTLYHSSKGRMKNFLRWVDYAMIATASICLSRAMNIESPMLVTAASAALLPVQPLMVSALHTGMMEVAFAKRALKDRELKTAHDLHKMSSLIGGALFVADDMFPATPFLHAGWHLAAAVGVGTCNKLLQ